MKRFKTAADIKVGVIGYGGAFNMGRIHLTDMRAAGMTPTAVADPDTARLKVAETDFPGIETYASVAQMLRKSAVNLIVIITPHNTHAALALQCLRAGRHVVCEKPMAVTTAECDAMIRLAKAKKLMITTYHNRHWDGCVLQALKVIRAGTIGDVYRIEAHMGGYATPRDWWRASKTISGGILYDWGVHLLEYSLQIIDSKIREVIGFAHRGYWAKTSKWGRDANEDEGLAVVRFANGAWLQLSISALDANPKRGMLEITGTGGSYIFDGRTYEVIVPKKGQMISTKGDNPPSEWPKFYANIADHLAKGTPLVITPEWARRPIHIIDLACRSAAAGTGLRAKYA